MGNMEIDIKEGDIIELDKYIKAKCKTNFNFIIVDKIENFTIDATFIEDKDSKNSTTYSSELLKGYTFFIKLYDIYY